MSNFKPLWGLPGATYAESEAGTPGSEFGALDGATDEQIEAAQREADPWPLERGFLVAVVIVSILAFAVFGPLGLRWLP